MDPTYIKPSNAELNPICLLIALVGTHHILHVSRVGVKGCLLSKAQTGRIVIPNEFEWKQKSPAIQDSALLREKNNFNISSRV
jgi:hypothetical protein